MASRVTLSRIAINKILFATDFSPESNNAMGCAISLAMRYQSTLAITHVVSMAALVTMSDNWPLVEDVAREQAKKNMAKLEDSPELLAVPHEAVLASGDAEDAIVQTVVDKSVDLVVMGTHGYGGAKKLLLGSTAEKVMRHAPCPVLTIGAHVQLTAPNRFNHVLYTTDFSSGSTRALTYALSLAQADRAELTLLHVIQSSAVPDSQLMECRQQYREHLSRMLPCEVDLAYKPDIEVDVGVPAVEIVRLAEARYADLIVMGSHAGGAILTHVPWTTLHYVLQHAQCPVLTVRGESSSSEVIMQLHLDTAELNLLADILLEQARRTSTESTVAASAQRDLGFGQSSCTDNDLLNKILARDLRLDSDELVRVGELLGKRERQLKDAIDLARNSPASSSLRQKLKALERVLERVNEACAMF